MLQENLGVGKEQVEEIYNNASMGGFEVIKLVHNSPLDSKSIKEINGFDVLTGVTGFSNDPMSSLGNVGVEKGRIYFYPDMRGFSWAYIPRTNGNIRRLVHSLAQNDYRIADQAVLKEVKQIAREEGLPLEPAKVQSEFVVKTSGEKNAEKKIDKMEEEKRLYEQKLALLEKKLAAAESKVAEIKEENTIEVEPEVHVEVDEKGEAQEKTPPKKTRKA